jgi:5-histidylcysteine sulfoxide synthase
MGEGGILQQEQESHETLEAKRRKEVQQGQQGPQGDVCKRGKDCSGNAKTSATIGAFRDDGKELKTLPADLAPLREATGGAWDRLVPGHHLNHAAFGAAWSACQDVAAALRRRAEANPNAFYDDLCLPLLRESRRVASEFLAGPTELFPTTSTAMKAVLEVHTAKRVAYLPPLYGATVTLLGQLFGERATEVSVPAAAFCEDPADLLAALDAAFAARPFGVLVADHVASLSGRILPMTPVVTWCRDKGVVCIIDGTQSANFDLAAWPDYYVVGSQKWLCNVKACAMVRVDPGALPPRPVAYSFGLDEGDPHIWCGCLDYTPWIVLAKALRIYAARGAELRAAASRALDEGLAIVGQRALPRGVERTFDLVKVRRFEADPQKTLNAAGVWASLKRIDGETYIRVSAWEYTTPADFVALADVLNYNTRLDRGIGATDQERAEQKRREILTVFRATMDKTTSEFAQLTIPAYFHRSEVLRHPPVFYFGHCAVFFINKLVLGAYLPESARIDPELESLNAVGVDEMSWDDLWLGNWDKVPPENQAAQVARIAKYREKMQALVEDMILNFPLTLPISAKSFWWVIMMGMEHERIHIETSSCIFAQMPLELMKPQASWPLCQETRPLADVPRNKLVAVKGGTASIGRAWEGTPWFGWDNEFGQVLHKELVDFSVSQMLVSNAEYKEFIDGGGYDNKEYWTEAGWTSRCYYKSTAPRFWMNANYAKTGKLRTLSREIDMPWDWPVECNHYEAEAFCNWKGAQLGKKVRLLTYPEWYLLRQRAKRGDYNINLKDTAGPCPVDRHGEPLGSAEPIYDITGNAWQHSVSALSVLKEFHTHHLYDDFTTPTIDGEHFFLLGGSWISIGDCARPEGRYGFRPHFYQWAGIRYVVSENEVCKPPEKAFSSSLGQLISEHYLDFTDDVKLDTPPVRNAQAWIAEQVAAVVPPKAELVVLQGGPGRLTAELVHRLSSGPGLSSMCHTDCSAQYLDVLQAGIKDGELRWERTLEGIIDATETYTFPEAMLAALRATPVSYFQVDLWKDLRRGETGCLRLGKCFDVAVADLSVLGRIDWPTRGLVPPDLHTTVKEGGRLVLVRPRDSPPFDPPAGFVRDEQFPAKTFAHIARDTRRKHTFAVSELTVWLRTATASEAVDPSNVVVDLPGEPEYYAKPSIVEAYDKFHFGSTRYFGIRNFCEHFAEVLVRVCKEQGCGFARALDCGCGPGRSAVDLAAHFHEVVAFDFAPDLVDLLTKPNGRKPENVKAFVGDATKMTTDTNITGQFDLIVGANLVDRLPDPSVWIEQSKALLRPGGVLAVLSPFTWLEKFVPQDNWLGGYRARSEVVWTLHGIMNACAPLELCTAPAHVPFVIPDVDGSYQYTYSQLLVFTAPREGAPTKSFVHAGTATEPPFATAL